MGEVPLSKEGGVSNKSSKHRESKKRIDHRRKGEEGVHEETLYHWREHPCGDMLHI